MRSQARVRVPATTANLGPGFDVLGLALALYNEVEIRIDADRDDDDFIGVSGSESSADVPVDDRNYVARGVDMAFRQAGLRPPPYRLDIQQEIPVARGLGSSAAALVGGAFAASSLLVEETDPSELVFALSDIEGHPEQLAAATFGGLVAAAPPDDLTLPGRPASKTPALFDIPVADSLLIALAVPDIELETKQARAVLPADVLFADAIWNVASVSALIAGLGDADPFLIRLGMRDKLHQDARAALVPASVDVLAAARDAGALGAAWSGGGPAMLGICADEDAANEVATAMVHAFERAKIDAEPLVLDIDLDGCVTLEIDGEPVGDDPEDT